MSVFVATWVRTGGVVGRDESFKSMTGPPYFEESRLPPRDGKECSIIELSEWLCCDGGWFIIGIRVEDDDGGRSCDTVTLTTGSLLVRKIDFGFVLAPWFDVAFLFRIVAMDGFGGRLAFDDFFNGRASLESLRTDASRDTATL